VDCRSYVAPVKSELPAHTATEQASIVKTPSSSTSIPTPMLSQARRQLVETAEAERRVILTCDRVFVRARHSDFTYFVRAERKQEQLEEVHPRRGALLGAHFCSGLGFKSGYVLGAVTCYCPQSTRVASSY